ncbi:hypothetical protein CASFOL_022045 [Castilleja foliolosa]|uniref:F-box domain-containing protein n=1 Tax=Castilleja foliolosa TaxID=1961234 RepID=A0ABD3D1U3_9LAMI
MNKHSIKRRRVDDDDGSAITVDRLSQLPQPILHNILSLLPQRDSVRASLLSKSWRYLWHGRLNVEFCDIDYCLDRKEEFWPFLDKTLQRYLDQNFSLQKFQVGIYRQEVDFALLQKWIPVLIMNMGVRSFNLIFHESFIFFPLPLVVVFQSESLVELHLQQCDLNIFKFTDNVMLNNLRTLRLSYVRIRDEIFDKIISGCPLIENLDLTWCHFLKSIKLRKHCNIKKFRCMAPHETIVEIENPQTLESVCINCRDWFCHRNTHFPHLKSLKLYGVQLPADMFDNFSSFFPCLNELILDSCPGLNVFRLLSSSIKRLTMNMYSIIRGKRIKAFIDTPNIRYFEYSGHGFLPSIKFTTTSNEWKSQISLWSKPQHSDNDAMSWFLKLHKLLKALSQSHITLSLNPNEYKKLHINDSYGGFYKPVVVEHINFESSFDTAILNCLFRICHPRYIHMDLYDDDMYGDEPELNSLAVFMSKLIPNEIGCYFWLKDLEEVGIEVRGEHAEDWYCVEGKSLLALPFQQQIRFQLTWKEQLSKFT